MAAAYIRGGAEAFGAGVGGASRIYWEVSSSDSLPHDMVGLFSGAGK